MVQAIIRGDKTQTRRVVKPQPDPDGEAPTFMLFPLFLDWEQIYNDVWKPWHWDTEEGQSIATFGRYGMKGNNLWVRETFANYTYSTPTKPWNWGIKYKADTAVDDIKNYKWKPSIHMPRTTSRLLLEVTTNHRIERLQDISEADAIAEGVEVTHMHEGKPSLFRNYESKNAPPLTHAKASFYSLWCKINGADSWFANPWVWVINFKKL